MDKDFWRSIVENDCAIPAGHTARELLDELTENLASTDAELRDNLALTILATWLERGAYTNIEMRALIPPMLIGLRAGIGEIGTDLVFQRTFSALILAELVHVDNKQPYLLDSEVFDVMDKALAYLLAEHDPRGYVPGKGWAHALAHTADLLMVLARSRYLGKSELLHILQVIAARLVDTGHIIYIDNEDERLVNAVMAVLERNLLELDNLKAWSESIVRPDGEGWKDAFLSETRNRTRFNIKTFLRSLHYRLVKSEAPPAIAAEFIPVLRESLKVLTPWA
jgi:hypothetical protein